MNILKLKHKTLTSLYVVNILLLILLAGSYLSSYLDPERFWFIAMLGLAFPVLFVVALVFTLFWFFAQRRKTILSVIVLLFGLPAIFHSFAFNTKKTFELKKQSQSLRIISWNVGLMNFTAPDVATAIKQNLVILNELKTYNADVICLQEFFTAVIPGTNLNFIDSIGSTMGYPYQYFSRDNPYFSKTYYSGSIIFSKYKIIDSNRYAFPDGSFGSMIKTGLIVNKDTINVFTTRLQSMGFKPYEYQVINNIKTVDNDAFRGSGNVFRKLKGGYAKKSAQVKMVAELLKENRKPIIFTGDFNDVPTSFAYNKIKGDMDDAWLKNGFGIGRTFKFISPTLRIDYILYNHFFTSVQTKRIITTGSDHYGLVTDLILKQTAE